MSELELNELVNKIKNRRIELNLSYQDLSDLTGISKSTLQRYETGFIKKVPITQIQIIAKALNVNPGYLMGWEPIPSTPITLTPPEEIHIKKYRQIDDDGKEEIDNMIDFKLKKTETKQKNKSRILTLEPAEPADVIANCVEQIRPRKTGS